MQSNTHSEINLATLPSFWAGEPGTMTDSLVIVLTNATCTLDLQPQTGIIGRKVSIVNDGGLIVGDGIVGWN